MEGAGLQLLLLRNCEFLCVYNQNALCLYMVTVVALRYSMLPRSLAEIRLVRDYMACSAHAQPRCVRETAVFRVLRIKPHVWSVANRGARLQCCRVCRYAVSEPLCVYLDYAKQLASVTTKNCM